MLNINKCCDSAIYYLEYEVISYKDRKVRWLPSYRYWQYNPGSSRPEFKYCPFCGAKLQDKTSVD